MGGYGRTISHVILGLKTAKGSKTLKLDPTIHDSLSKEGVAVGDVIYIEANSGAVKRVGRSDSFATEFDLLRMHLRLGATVLCLVLLCCFAVALRIACTSSFSTRQRAR